MLDNLKEICIFKIEIGLKTAFNLKPFVSSTLKTVFNFSPTYMIWYMGQ